MRTVIAAAILACAAVGPAAAASVAAPEADYLYTEVSKAGETLDEFVMRIAPRATAFTEKNWVEVCGELVERNGIYSVEFHTSRKRNRCYIPNLRDGSQIVHTHAKGEISTFSKKDYSVPGYLIMVSVVLHQSGQGTERFVGKF